MKILLRKRKVVKIPLYELRGPKFLLVVTWDIGTVQGDLVSNFFRDRDHLHLQGSKEGQNKLEVEPWIYIIVPTHWRASCTPILQ